ncbi:MAG: Ig-like domain-containing protein, partial [Verrucomicrobiales bacterium]|nr:Ig-like domain-containing protein [Verrucomicrobiales bacterium]
MNNRLFRACLAALAGCLGLAAVAQVPGAPQVFIRQVPPQSVELAWPLSVGDFVVERTRSLNPPIAWEVFPATPLLQGDRVSATIPVDSGNRFYRLRQTVATLVFVDSTSPATGESGVAVTRESIFRLSGALAEDTVLGTNQVQAMAGGRRVLSRVELSGDRRAVTLFYLEPLPADARVQVTFDGTGVFDAFNRPIDLDGDGVIGGAVHLSFETLSTTALSTTGIEGRVFASEKNPDGTDRPLRDVTITVDGKEETLRTTTDAAGFFRLMPCPAGRFFVSVDGRTAEGSQWPGGAYYPFVGKAWEAAPGRTNNLAGGSGVVYLPLVQADALRPVSATTETKITFAPSVLATNPALAGTEVSVPPNGLFADSGVRGGRVGIAPVPFDRLPEPLPPGLNLPLVITIQTDGPSNFDGVVPVRFPNLPDPVTGVRLGPGEKTALWSFNHDTGRWEIQGSMTISADGLFAVSDPGVGVRQPGWHGSAPGGGGGGPGGPGGPRRCPNPPCPDDDEEEEKKNPCDSKAALTFLAINDLALDLSVEATGGASKDPIANCLFGSGVNAMRTVRDCQLQDDAGCRGTMKNNYIGSALGCIPKVGGILSLGWGAKGLIDSIFDWYDCTQNQQGSGVALAATPGPNPVAGVLAQVIAQLEKQIALSEAARGYLTGLYGSEVWSGPESPADAVVYAELFARIEAAQAEDSPGGELFTDPERAALEAAPLPSRVKVADLRALLDRSQRMAKQEFVTDPVLRDEIRTAAARFLAVAEPLLAEGWEHYFSGLERAVTLLGGLTSNGSYPGSGFRGGAALAVGRASVALAGPSSEPAMYRFPIRPLFFRLLNLTSGFEQRGRLNPSALFEGVILAPQAWYVVEYFDSVRRRLGTAHFRSGRSGSTTLIPAALMLERVDHDLDSDGDGLTDAAERVIGTGGGRFDTDGDGLSDGAEIANGTNPSDGQPLGLGVVATRQSEGDAVDLDTVNDYAVIANGTAGLAVFNVGNPVAPVLVSRFTQAGRRFDALATSGEFVAAVPGTTTLAGAGIQVFGLGADGNLAPRAMTLLGEVPKAVVASGRYAYVPARDGTTRSLAVVRLSDTLVLRRVDVSEVGEVTTLAVEGDVLWALSSDRLSSFRMEADTLLPLGQVALSGLGASPLEPGLELASGNGRVYVGEFRGFRIFDATNPADPRFLYAPPTTQAAIHDLALNGSGLMVPVTSFSGTTTLALSAYDIRADRSTNFLTSFDTPGTTRAAVLHRGYALTADGSSGLTTVNFLAADRGTNPPSIVLRPFPTHGAAGTESDELFQVSAVTTDDVQVRDVEFYIDGAPVALGGKFPFAASLRAPARLPDRTSFRLRAKATDTAGNSAWSDEMSVALLPDMTPPYVVSFSPPHNSTQPRGSVASLAVQFDSAVNPATLQNAWTLQAAGADGSLGTPDDVAIGEGQVAFDPTTRVGTWRFNAPLLSGKYRAVLAASVADLGGNPLSQATTWDFTLPAPLPVRSDPSDGAVLLSGTQRRFAVTFDERLSPASVTPGSLRLITTNAVNPQVIGGATASVAADGRTAVLEFGQPVADGRYRLVFTSAILDAYGSPVGTNLPVTVTVKGPAVWVSDLDGLWQSATNWSLGVPVAGDNVVIDRPNATPTVTMGVDATVSTLRSEEPFVLDGRSLTVRSQAVFNGPFVWANQTRLSGGVIEWRGGVVATGTANKFLAGTTVRNAGLFDWRQGGILINFPGSEFHNLPGAV